MRRNHREMPHEIAAQSDMSIAASPSSKDNDRMYLTDVSPYLEVLTQKQLKFVYSLIDHGLNPSKAAVEAGMSDTYGRKLMNDIRIRRAYTALMGQQSFWKVASHNEALAYATKVMRGETYDEVINPKTGNKERIKTPTRDTVKFTEFLMKHNKILSDGKLDVTITPGQTIYVDIEDFEVEDINPRKDITDDVIEI